MGRVENPALVLARPDRSILIRGRLLRALHDPLALTIVRSPAVTGKSVMVDSWLMSGAVSDSVVVRVPECSRGQTTDQFWISVAGAMVEAAEVATAVDQEPSAIIADWLEHVGRKVILAIDHPDRVVGAGVEDALVALAARFHHLHLVVSMRGSNLFADMVQCGLDFRLIGPDELRFTGEETDELMAQSGAPPPPHLSARLYCQLGGMPWLVRAATRVLWQFTDQDPESEAAWSALRRFVRELLEAGEVGLEDPTAAWTIGVAAAVLGEATPEMVLALLGECGAEQQDELTQGLSAVCVSGSGPTTGWRLIPLVQEVVLAALAEVGSERYRGVLSRMSSTLLERGDVAAALRTSSSAGDWEFAGEVLSSNWSALLRTDLVVVREVLAAFPVETADRYAIISAGRDLFAGLEAGIAVPHDSGEDLGEFLAVGGTPMEFQELIGAATVRSIGLRLSGDFAESAELTRRVAELHQSADEHDRQQVSDGLAMMRLQWGINFQLAGKVKLADLEFRIACALGVSDGVEYVARNAVGSLALADALGGELVSAAAWLEMASSYDEGPGWLGPRVRVSGDVARVFVSAGKMDLPAAQSALAELGMPDDIEELWAPMVLAHSEVAHALGHHEAALDLVLRATATYQRWCTEDAWARLLMSVAAARLYCAIGQGNRALAMLADVPGGHPMVLTTRGLLHLLSGDPAQALIEVDGLAWHPDASARASVEALLIAGAAHAELGEAEAARAALRRVGELAEQTAQVKALLLLPAGRRASLLAAGLATGPLRRTWELHSEAHLYPEEIRTVILSVRELAVLRLLAQGRSQREIAEELFVSPNTIKTQLRSIYRKLGSSTRDDAVHTGESLGLI